MIGKIFSAAAAEPISAIGKVVDGPFTSDEERLDKKAVLARIAQQPQLIQAEINKIEAGHRSVFVAGWRPFIGWVCGAALAYNFSLRDLIMWGMTMSAATLTPPPAIHLETLTTILFALLGLGTLRTVEKSQGRAK